MSHPGVNDTREWADATVLLADDSVVSAKLAGLLIRREGISVEVVRTGREALETLSRISCRLIFMDVQMPDMDGFEATAAIRQGEVPGLDPSVPVIAMTGHSMKGDRERCLAAGMTDYLSKPLDLLELRRILFQYLRPVRTTTLNLHEVRRRIGNDEELLKEMLEVFIVEAPKTLEELEDALRSEDFSALRHLAHRLQGAARSIGADGVASAAREVEECAGNAMPAAVHTEEHLVILRTRLAGVLAAIDRLSAGA